MNNIRKNIKVDDYEIRIRDKIQDKAITSEKTLRLDNTMLFDIMLRSRQ